MAGSRGPPSVRRRRPAVPSRRRSSAIGELVDDLDQRAGVLDRSLRENPVTEIEDVSRAAAGAAEDVLYPLADVGGPGQEHHRVEITLDRDVVAHGRPARVEIDAPVQRSEEHTSEL